MIIADVFIRIIIETLTEYYDGNELKAYAAFIFGGLVIVVILFGIAYYVSLA